MWYTTKRRPEAELFNPPGKTKFVILVMRNRDGSLKAAIVLYNSADGTCTAHTENIDHLPLEHFDLWTTVPRIERCDE